MSLLPRGRSTTRPRRWCRKRPSTASGTLPTISVIGSTAWPARLRHAVRCPSECWFQTSPTRSSRRSWRGAEATLARAGFSLLLSSTDNDEDKARGQLDVMIEGPRRRVIAGHGAAPRSRGGPVACECHPGCPVQPHRRRRGHLFGCSGRRLRGAARCHPPARIGASPRGPGSRTAVHFQWAAVGCEPSVGRPGDSAWSSTWSRPPPSTRQQG